MRVDETMCIDSEKLKNRLREYHAVGMKLGANLDPVYACQFGNGFVMALLAQMATDEQWAAALEAVEIDA